MLFLVRMDVNIPHDPPAEQATVIALAQHPSAIA